MWAKIAALSLGCVLAIAALAMADTAALHWQQLDVPEAPTPAVGTPSPTPHPGRVVQWTLFSNRTPIATIPRANATPEPQRMQTEVPEYRANIPGVSPGVLLELTAHDAQGGVSAFSNAQPFPSYTPTHTPTHTPTVKPTTTIAAPFLFPIYP